MALLMLLAQALWFIWPAYTANAFPPLVKGEKPLDFGRNFHGKRILGDSKTIEGTIGGILFGIFIGFIQMNIYGFLPELGLVKFTAELVVLLSVGALVGDVLGSFIKRRLGIEPSQPAILLDQLGFLLAALLFASAVFVPPLEIIVLLIILTPLIHFLTNAIGYALNLKRYPW